MIEIFFFLFLMQVKHQIADFLYQPPYMWQNKGTYGHPGGIWHAGVHALFTAAILGVFYVFYNLPDWIFYIVFLEFVWHYHTDWFKMWWNKRKNYNPSVEKFWHWLGWDQMSHQVNYLVSAYILYSAMI